MIIKNYVFNEEQLETGGAESIIEPGSDKPLFEGETIVEQPITDQPVVPPLPGEDQVAEKPPELSKEILDGLSKPAGTVEETPETTRPGLPAGEDRKQEQPTGRLAKPEPGQRQADPGPPEPKTENRPTRKADRQQKRNDANEREPTLLGFGNRGRNTQAH